MINDVITYYKEQIKLNKDQIRDAFILCSNCINEVLHSEKKYNDIVMDLVNLKSSQYESRKENNHFYVSELAKILFVEMMYDQNIYQKLSKIAKENEIIEEVVKV